MKKLILFMLTVSVFAAIPARALQLLCIGKTLGVDQHGYKQDTEYNFDYGYYGRDHFGLEIVIGQSRETLKGSHGQNNYFIYGGRAEVSHDQKTYPLIASGLTTFFPNYGPIPLRNGRTIDLGSFEVIKKGVVILHLKSGTDVSLNCRMNP